MLKSWIAKLRGSSPKLAPISPDKVIHVIGDIHGRADLLESLLDKVPESETVICVGDYVDRGENSAGVLRLLLAHPEIICLKGNHEEMMLSFLNDPEQNGSRWLRYGGLQTLASFGVGNVSEASNPEELIRARDALRDAMGPEMQFWLRSLHLYYQSGNVGIVHAAADPGTPLNDQQQRHLLWGAPKFGKSQRTDGLWIVHGHTIVSEPTVSNGIISIDTGAYATGVLTAAKLSDDGIEFNTT
ncbi:MAG: metallophosphoesterase family protein [Paracoccaceae bacterium]